MARRPCRKTHRTSRPRRRGIPNLSHHKASGQAVVRIAGKDCYCGPWDVQTDQPSKEALSKYHRLISEWLASDQAIAPSEDRRIETVAELCDAYHSHAHIYYRKDGKPTPEIDHIRTIIKRLLQLYAECFVEEFDSLKLKAIRRHLIERGLARTTINQHVGRIKRMFGWAGENKLIDPLLHYRLLCVKGLRRGRGGRETARRMPALWSHVRAVQPYVSRQVWTMILLQWHTGMRPGSAIIMRSCDIDISGGTWFYRPSDHKTIYLDRELVIALGPKAREVLQPWLRPDMEAYLFQPAEAVAEWRAALIAERKARGGVGNHKRRVRRSKRRPGECYTVASYRRAITKACLKAAEADWRAEHGGTGLKPVATHTDEFAAYLAARRWTPHQLRHSFATRAGDEFDGDLDKVAAALGHRNVDVTMLYAHLNRKKAAEVARRIG